MFSSAQSCCGPQAAPLLQLPEKSPTDLHPSCSINPGWNLCYEKWLQHSSSSTTPGVIPALCFRWLQHTEKPPCLGSETLQNCSFHLCSRAAPRECSGDLQNTNICCRAGSWDGRFLPTAWIFFSGLESTAQKCGVYDENVARLLSAAIPGLVTAQWRAGASVI